MNTGDLSSGHVTRAAGPELLIPRFVTKRAQKVVSIRDAPPATAGLKNWRH